MKYMGMVYHSTNLSYEKMGSFSVFRIENNLNFTVMSIHHFRDKSISYKACGLLSKMLALSDG